MLKAYANLFDSQVETLEKLLNLQPSDYITLKERDLELQALKDDLEYDAGEGDYAPDYDMLNEETTSDKQEELEALEASRDAYHDTKHPDAL